MQTIWAEAIPLVQKYWRKLDLCSNFRIYEHILLHHGHQLLERFPEGLGRHSQQILERSNGTDVAFQHKHTSQKGGKVKGQKQAPTKTKSSSSQNSSKRKRRSRNISASSSSDQKANDFVTLEDMRQTHSNSNDARNQRIGAFYAKVLVQPYLRLVIETKYSLPASKSLRPTINSTPEKCRKRKIGELAFETKQGSPKKPCLQSRGAGGRFVVASSPSPSPPSSPCSSSSPSSPPLPV